jgi:hypothetical protein
MKLSISLTNYSWQGGPERIAGHVTNLARRVDDAGVDVGDDPPTGAAGQDGHNP